MSVPPPVIRQDVQAPSGMLPLLRLIHVDLHFAAWNNKGPVEAMK